MQIAVAARSCAPTILDRSTPGSGFEYHSSNGCRSAFSVLYSPVQIEDLRWADHPFRESYQMSESIQSQKLILN
jgi:hypothetical protein